jgi:hypothetical protein
MLKILIDPALIVLPRIQHMCNVLSYIFNKNRLLYKVKPIDYELS